MNQILQYSKVKGSVEIKLLQAFEATISTFSVKSYEQLHL